MPDASTQLRVDSFHRATEWKMHAKRCRMKRTTQTRDTMRTTTRPMRISKCLITEGACSIEALSWKMLLPVQQRMQLFFSTAMVHSTLIGVAGKITISRQKAQRKRTGKKLMWLAVQVPV